MKPTGRPAKSTSSVVDKLKRESIRLSQIQDIAGCRLIAKDMAAQDAAVAILKATFPEASVVDRRMNPSYGYRAVHIIVTTGGRNIEIQVRSKLQHLWAEFSEKLSDVVDPKVKYGGGPEALSRMLAEISGAIAEVEAMEAPYRMLGKARRHSRRIGPEVEQQLSDVRALMVALRQRLRVFLIESIAAAKK
jgi:GTP pyrophosphokinase